MKEDDIERLVETYKNGTSNLTEEQFLSDNSKNLGSSLELWFDFVKRNRKLAPKNLNDNFQASYPNKNL